MVTICLVGWCYWGYLPGAKAVVLLFTVQKNRRL